MAGLDQVGNDRKEGFASEEEGIAGEKDVTVVTVGFGGKWEMGNEKLQIMGD